MNFYMDESKVAEAIINNKDLGYKPSESIYLLAKYFYYTKNLKGNNLEKAIIEVIKSSPINYKPSEWDKCISKNIIKAKKYPLVKIDHISITEEEMYLIQSLDSNPLQRVAFTLLCLAKYHNAISEKNNNWVNSPLSDIFKQANILSRTQEDKLGMIHTLYKKYNMVSFSKKNTNVNMRVEYVLPNSSEILRITDMRELGKQYMMYCGKRYVKCERCGVVFRQTKNNGKYCKDCRGYKPINTKTMVCCDCGKEFEVDGIVKNKKRCDECQRMKNKQDNIKRVYKCLHKLN